MMGEKFVRTIQRPAFMPYQTLNVRSFVVALALSLLFLFAFTHLHAQSPSNGLTLDRADPAAAQGVVHVLGVADHPTFRKWQLDLLLDGGDTVFLAVSEEAMPTPGLLAALDTTLYPDGPHQLRLRVVYRQLNYDEFFLPITITNQGGAALRPAAPPLKPTPAPQMVAAPAPVAPPAGNGLSLVTQGGLVSVLGVADHPAFRKWQVDVLLYGDANQPIFLAVGEERVPSAKELVTFTSADFPEGEHQIRLRVVRGDQNYDEFFLPFAIGPGNVNPASGPLLIHGAANGKAIYLTFDDGPHPDHTPQILNVLAEYNAAATFFVVGSRAQGQEALLKEMYEAGHAIGNHSWSHRKLDTLDWESFDEEVGATAALLGGYGSRCLRPPYGNVGPQLYANAKQAGYRIIYWSVDPLDWLNQNPETIANRVLARARPGAIVLLHDGGGDRAGTVAALRTILATLTAEGYSFPALCR
ncbi:MAG: polysaccharide deacetylase family protein [Chloroflexi bacterium]|nr:MAG: polysaccharide deacetylase family protein [Chloroflexota bacterium]